MLPRMSRMVYGKRPVMEALRFQTGQVQQLLVDQSKAKILSEVLDLAKKVGVKAQWTSRAQLDQLTQGGNHQGAALTVREFDYTSIKDFLAGAGKNAQVVVALDGVTDPQNLGSCLRAAGAFGADLVIITKDRSAQVNAATTRAAAGATEAVPIARETNLVRALEQLQQAGFWCTVWRSRARGRSARRICAARWFWCWAPRAKGCDAWWRRPATSWCI